MADFSEARAVMVIYGQPLSLKTTLAMDLARYMQTGLICTGFFGAVRDADEKAFLTTRRRRYELATRIMRSYLAEGVSVVVEGTFERPEWRRFVFEVAAAWASGLVLIRCYCSDAEERLRRQRIRASDPFAMDRGNAPYSTAAAEYEAGMVENDEVPESLRPAPSYHVDTGSWNILTVEDRPEWGVRRALEAWVCRMTGDGV